VGRTKIATCNIETGHITVNRKIHGRERMAVLRHMQTYVDARQKGVSRTEALRQANSAERGAMTKREFQRHNGRLGAKARWEL
jgi:hypothetical protein